MIQNHLMLDDLPYCGKVKRWLKERYGDAQADDIWRKTEADYAAYLNDLPDYGGKKNGHAYAIYGGLLIFSLVPSLPDRPPRAELQDFVQKLFMEPFIKLGKVFDLNRSLDMWLIDRAFRRSGDRDRKDAVKYPAGFINVDEPYDKEHRAARYSFTQCPNATFAKKHGLLPVLPLLCNSDFFGISEIHGTLIRCGTCGNSDRCDYLVVGDHRALVSLYLDSTADINGTRAEGYSIKTVHGRDNYWYLLRDALRMDSDNNPRIVYVNFDKLREALESDASSNDPVYDEVFALAKAKEKALESSKKDRLNSPYQFESGAYSRSLPDAGYRVNTKSQTETSQFAKWFDGSVAKNEDGTPAEFWKTSNGYTSDRSAAISDNVRHVCQKWG